jgi:hypothetical protein
VALRERNAGVDREVVGRRTSSVVAYLRLRRLRVVLTPTNAMW